MEGNIRIYRLPKIHTRPQGQSVCPDISFHFSNYCVYCIEDQNLEHNINAQQFFKESRNLIGTIILYADIDRSKTVYWYHQSIHGFWTSLCQHPSLYRGIVKVTWRVLNQLNVCFLIC